MIKNDSACHFQPVMSLDHATVPQTVTTQSPCVTKVCVVACPGIRPSMPLASAGKVRWLWFDGKHTHIKIKKKQNPAWYIY